MSEAIKKILFGKNTIQGAVAIMFSLAIIAFIFGTTFIKIPEGNKEQLLTNSNFLFMTAGGAILYFLFGSSKGSQDKDEKSKPGRTPDAS